MKQFEDLGFADIERSKRRAITAVIKILDSVEAKIVLVRNFEYVPVEEARLASKIIFGLNLIKNYLCAQAKMVSDVKIKRSIDSDVSQIENVWVPMMLEVKNKPEVRICPVIPKLTQFLLQIEELDVKELEARRWLKKAA